MSESNEAKVVYLKTAAMVGIVAVLFLGWLWWAQVVMSAQNVFNGMIQKSLSTTGVTKAINQDTQSGKLEQLAQAQFGAQNLVEVKTTVNQPTEGGEAKVITQTIATPEDNFVRYKEISLPVQKDKPKTDFSSLVGTWGKEVKAEGGNGVFSEAVFGIVLFGNLPANQRDELINFMHEKNIYKVDYDKVTSKNVDGKSAYVYPVEVNTAGYVELLKKYDGMLGLGATDQLDAAAYKDKPPIKAEMSVSKNGRQLLKLKYEDEDRSETYIGYGIRKDLQVPQDAIARKQLEAKLQKLLSRSEKQ